MRILHTIPRNIVAAYRCSAETSLLPQEQGRTLRSEDISWDDRLVPDLKTLAIQAIASTWRNNPILEDLPTCADRDMLMEILPTDLPFELTITRIENEFYWERAAKDRWEYNDPDEHGNSWRRLYCERHLAEYLETLPASYFEGQRGEFEKLVSLVKDYVCVIRIRCLVPIKKLRERINAENNESDIAEDIVHHIPMAIILPQFPHLTTIYFNFGMIYMDNGFEWRDFEFSVEDCVSLGKGIKASPKLRKFSLTRSNLDRPRVAAILQGTALNSNLEDLDLSHCKLADTGAHAVGEFLSMHKTLKSVHLTNNNIGPSGVAGIVHGMLKTNTTVLKCLDLRLNPIEDEGAYHICALLVRNKTLEVLNISGCGITSEGGISIAEVLSSDCVELETFSLDISNNDLGPIAGKSFETTVKCCSYIIHIDNRMCNFSKESEYSINECIHRNKKDMKKKMENKMAFRQKNDVLPNPRNPQRQPEVEVVFPESKDIAKHSTGRQIDADELEILKSILRNRNTSNPVSQGREINFPIHGKFKASFGSDSQAEKHDGT